MDAGGLTGPFFQLNLLLALRQKNYLLHILYYYPTIFKALIQFISLKICYNEGKIISRRTYGIYGFYESARL